MGNFWPQGPASKASSSASAALALVAERIGRTAAASVVRALQLAQSRLLRVSCTMHVCGVVAGKIAPNASGTPFGPSVIVVRKSV